MRKAALGGGCADWALPAIDVVTRRCLSGGGRGASWACSPCARRGSSLCGLPAASARSAGLRRRGRAWRPASLASRHGFLAVGGLGSRPAAASCLGRAACAAPSARLGSVGRRRLRSTVAASAAAWPAASAAAAVGHGSASALRRRHASAAGCVHRLGLCGRTRRARLVAPDVDAPAGELGRQPGVLALAADRQREHPLGHRHGWRCGSPRRC